LASYYFYMSWNYKYIILIIASTVIDYFAGIHMARTGRKHKKKLLLLLSLCANLGMLFFFKYYNFFTVNANYIFEQFNIFYHFPSLHFLLPVGISFYTFQTLSYTIDVYRGNKTPERHFGKFALYVSFFPQLVAGPIERSERLLPQFHKEISFNYHRVRDGLILMIWGMFKKVVIADRLAEYVNLVYNQQQDFEGIQNLIATIFFTFQIYCDFSGYSDIAIGAALVMGYRLMTNFRRPYLATSIREFWQRWHISLSTWFRDYLYIPLGGNRVVKWRWYFNLFITFLISGLWHGAAWTFVIWGALHGLYLIFGIFSKNLEKRYFPSFADKNKNLVYFYNVIVTFVLVVFAWIFFRANNINDAFEIIGSMFTGSYSNIQVNLFEFKVDFLISFVSIGLLLAFEIFDEKLNWSNKLVKLPTLVKWALLIFVLLSIMILGKWNEVDFLYFQF
jgi:D-alanyl-lipoteichoic acid acyltransferase DltB (MBOAT superfamily)